MEGDFMNEDWLKKIEAQEKELQFTEFSNETALEIGLSIVERAKKDNLVITVEIIRNGHMLFHYAFDGTSPDNDQWVLKKSRTVNRFNHSSLYFVKSLEKREQFEQVYHVSLTDYACSGGGFPIIIKNTGVIGSITVSGLAEENDHQVVVDALREYLKS